MSAGRLGGAEGPVRATIDISTLTASQSHQYQRSLDAAGIDFLIARGQVSIPVVQADDAREILAALAEQGEPDDPDTPPFDDNPYHRQPIRGIGLPATRLSRWLGALVDGVWSGAVTLGLAAAGAPALAGWAVIGAVTIVMVATIGATPGKLALGTRVRSVATGGVVEWWRAAVRWLAPLALAFVAPFFPLGPMLAFLVYLGSCVLVLFSSDGRAVHDLVAGTIVVRAGSVASGGRM